MSQLQPIFKLPPIWNVKYPELSFPTILQIVSVVPSILSIDYIVQGHQVTLTKAATFESGNKLLPK